LGEDSQGGNESDENDVKIDKVEVQKEIIALKRDLLELLSGSASENATIALQKLKDSQQKGNGLLTKFVPKKKNVR
jgi:hypothetical protein